MTPAPRRPDPALLLILLLTGLLTACQFTAPPALPRVDLTTQNWFPPITRQQGNSCAQQAGLAYLLTAERNRQRRLSSWQPANRLSPYQTYAILADSLTSGTHVTDGWHLARETGVPRESDFPRASRGLMHGFDKYLRASRQRPASWQLLPLRTPADLMVIKNLLAAGHPLACDLQIRGSTFKKQPDRATLVTAWGRSGPGHTMIYAGYDNTIGHDFNHDGRLTNDLDITGDGRVTLADHELGALLVINPWGPGWGTRGRAWALPREHALSPWPRASYVAVVTSAPDSAPRLMLRLSIALTERRHLILTASDGTRQFQPLPFRSTPSAPVSSNPWETFGKLNRPGPPISAGPLSNPAGGPLEIGLALPTLSSRSSHYRLTLGTTGPPLRGTLHSAAFLELSPSGQILKETPLTGLPAVIPSQGLTWNN